MHPVSEPKPKRREEPWKRCTRQPSASTLRSEFKLEDDKSSISIPGPASPGFQRLQFGLEGNQGYHRSPYRWTSEFLSLLLGVCFLLVIVVALAAADGQVPPHWPLGVTLNTVLAFLASFSKAAFMFPIIQGLGQLKWIWFTSPETRRLGDFQVFDEASRGPWGSMKLLVRSKGLLASLGAVITISGFLTSTLTQQAIDYQQLWAESSEGFARVARATSCSLYNGTTLDIKPWAAVQEKQSVVNGAFHVPNDTIPHVVPECSSGQCSWEPYGSLAICSEVVNLTTSQNSALLKNLTASTSKRLNALVNRTDIFMQDGLLYSIFPLSSVPPSFPVILGPLSGPTGSFNESVSKLLLSSHFLAYSDTLVTAASASKAVFNFLEIGFYFCTKSMVTEVKDGVPRTTVLGAASQAISPDPHVLNFAWSPDFYPCYAASTCNETFGGLEVELQAPPNMTGPETYKINVWTSLVGSVVIGETMYDSILMDVTRGIVASTGGGIAEAFASTLFGDYMAVESPPPAMQLENVKGVVNNMAISMTNYLREGSIWYHDAENPATTNGTVYTPQTFVKIHWPYIVMLASQIVLTAVFLVSTTAATYISGIQILKGSSIATMCGLDKDTRAYLGDVSDFEKLKRRASRAAVRLERGSSGIALWLGLANRKQDDASIEKSYSVP